MALSLAAPGGRVLRAALLSTMPKVYDDHHLLKREMDEAGARFDGRLRIVAVDKRTGRRVVFGRPGSPRATVPEAVLASCAIPWVFQPVWIGGREYVDGGVWSATNLDVAPAGRDTHVLCLSPLGSLSGGHSLLGLARSAVRSAVSVEAMALRRRGAAVQTVSPDLDSATAMGPSPMDPGPRERVHAAGYRQGMELAATRADRAGGASTAR
jgi:NTE family protein